MTHERTIRKAIHRACGIGTWLLIAILLLGAFAPSAYAETINQIHIWLKDEDRTKVFDYYTKWNFQGAQVSVNNGDLQVADSVKIRGRSCTLGPRKCYGLKLPKSVKLNGPNAPEGKNLYLVSMRLDEGYISTRLGFEMFRALGIFDIKAEYAEVYINGNSYGLYLVTENPEQAIKRVSNKAYIGRRGYGATLETKDVPKKSGLTEANYIADFQDLYADLDRLSGKALEERLVARLDLDQYLTWILVNSVLINGDYSDEVFFYAEKKGDGLRWRIFPWDFDDLFKAPHSSSENTARMSDIENGLLYNFENPLDVKIHDDTILSKRLNATALELFTKRITPELVTSVFAKVETAISPYLDRPTALNPARWDDPYAHGRPYTKATVRDILADRRNRVLNRLDLLKNRANARTN